MNQSKLEKLALRPFNDILKTAKAIAKKWDLNSIPLNNLKIILNIAKANLNKMDMVTEAQIIKKKYIIIYDNLYKTCEKKSKEMGTNNVSIGFLESCINTIKKS